MTIDILVVGAGHDGLVCAFYLASAGLKVKLVERRDVGGAAVTEESHPGFRNSVAAYTASLLNPKVIAEMNLSVHGLTMVDRRASNFLPQPGGRCLLTGRTSAELAKFSVADAEAHPRHSDEIDAIADVLRGLVLKPPPNVVEGGLILQRIFRLIDGDIFHCALSPNQLFSAPAHGPCRLSHRRRDRRAGP